MPNLLEPSSGWVHADANDDGSPFVRMLCDLRAVVPDAWQLSGPAAAAKVTCPDCQFRIEVAQDEAEKAHRARNHTKRVRILGPTMEAVATAIWLMYRDRRTPSERQLLATMAANIAEKAYPNPDGESSRVAFLSWAIDGETVDILEES